MGRSNRLRLSEVRQALRLVGECRDLGRDTHAWFMHALAGTGRLLRANVVLGGLAPPEGFHTVSGLQLVLATGWESPSLERTASEYLAKDPHLRDPSFGPYLSIAKPDITLRPLRLISRKVFESSEYHADRISFGVEDLIFSQRVATDGLANFSLSPQRAAGDRYFTRRDVKLLRVFHDELALLVGGILSHAGGGHLEKLTPRLHQTLACLLSGASEKEAAKRMGLSRHTVHEYVVAIYRHFAVNSRAELMAFCRERGIDPAGPSIPGGRVNPSGDWSK